MSTFSHFFSKNTCELDIVLTRTVNILTTNELVKLMMLWTTGPRWQESACMTGSFLNLKNYSVKSGNITKKVDNSLSFNSTIITLNIWTS